MAKALPKVMPDFTVYFTTVSFSFSIIISPFLKLLS